MNLRLLLYEIIRIISWDRVGWKSCESASLESSVVGFEKVDINCDIPSGY